MTIDRNPHSKLDTPSHFLVQNIIKTLDRKGALLFHNFMIITEKFVLLNFPRTGSSFNRSMIKELYQQKTFTDRLFNKIGYKRSFLKELMLKSDRTRTARESGRIDQHGTYKQIPREYQKLPVVAAIRSPFDRIVSAYEYKWWANHPVAPIAEIEEAFPEFPNFTFPRFWEYMKTIDKQNELDGLELQADVGPITVRFIKFFFADPGKILAKMTNEYIENQKYLEELPEIKFLDTRNLNQDLHDCLLNLGYPADRLQFILKKKKINAATTREDKDWTNYFDDDLIEDVLFQERMLFDLFPQYRLK